MMSPCKIYSGADAYLLSISTKTEGKNQNDLNHRMNNLSIKNSLLLSSDASFKVKVFLYKEAYKFSEIKRE